MILTLTPTPEIVHVNGIPCRVWKGEADADAGTINVQAFVAMVTVSDELPDEAKALEAEQLQRIRPRLASGKVKQRFLL